MAEVSQARTKKHYLRSTRPWVREADVLTEGPGHSQEGDLVDDCTPPHGAIVGQPGPLPHNTVHPRLLHNTATTRLTRGL